MTKLENNKAECFLSIDEQIDRLVNVRKLKIKNKSLLKEYLKKYNYENFINNYSNFLLQEDGKTFIDGITEKTLISIFDFDREISFYLLRYVFELERMITTKIAYIIPKFYEKQIQELREGNILALSDKKFREIFPNPIGKVVLEEGMKQIFLQKEDLIKYCPEKLLSPNNPNPSLWKISTYWTTGILQKVYKSLTPKVQQAIIDDFEFDIEINLKEFYYVVIENLNIIRNRVCHNNMIYKYEYRAKKASIIKGFLQKTNKFTNATNQMRLWNVIVVFSLLTNNKSIIKGTESILENFKNHLINSIDNKELGNQIYKKIKEYVRYI